MNTLEISTIENGLAFEDPHVVKAALIACTNRKYNDIFFQRWWDTGKLNYRLGACLLNRTGALPTKYVSEILENTDVDPLIGKKILVAGYKSGQFLTNLFPPSIYEKYYSTELIKLCAGTANVQSTHIFEELLKSKSWYDKTLGLYFATIPEFNPDIGFKLLLPHAKDCTRIVRTAAVEALRAKNLSPGLLCSFYKAATTQNERITWMRVAKGRADVVLPIDPNAIEPGELPEANGLTVDKDTFDRFIDGTDEERAFALYSLVPSCSGYSEYVAMAMESFSPIVREAGMVLAGEDGFKLPRSIVVPETVYKKCVGDVIVEAEIPDDAVIRGLAGSRCRANKAVVKDVIGTYCGVSVGISFSDYTTYFYPSTYNRITDFDYSNTAGFDNEFTFYFTKEDALRSSS